MLKYVPFEMVDPFYYDTRELLSSNKAKRYITLLPIALIMFYLPSVIRDLSRTFGVDLTAGSPDY